MINIVLIQQVQQGEESVKVKITNKADSDVFFLEKENAKGTCKRNHAWVVHLTYARVGMFWICSCPV
ncbi:hypothetical protein [Anaerotignum sp.]|uniref:hypothetical protein n=1 Tax=Anaerotignum sp. TaxID=2039241 RepID=UPI00332A005B